MKKATSIVLLLLAGLLVASVPLLGQAVPADGAPLRVADGAPLRVAVISDLNGPYGSLDYDWHVDSTITRIIALAPDLVLASGDLIAGQDRRLSDDRFPAMWAVFEQRVGVRLREAGIPFAFTVGNHDGSPSAPFSRERDATRAHWTNPAHDPLLQITDSGDFPFYFSHQHDLPDARGSVFFISWDASSASITEPTRDWVRAQLASEAAQKAEFRVLLGHLPLYASAEGRNRAGEILRDTDDLLELLRTGEVDLYVSGHHHAYYPGSRAGIDLLQTGALGGGPRPWIGSDAAPRKSWTMIAFYGSQAARGEPRRIDYTTWDAETGATIGYGELPSYLYGITGYTVRRDVPETRHFRGELVWSEGGSDPIWGTFEAHIQGDFLRIVLTPKPDAPPLPESMMLRLHTRDSFGRLTREIIRLPFESPTMAVLVLRNLLDSDALRGGIYRMVLSSMEDHDFRIEAQLLPVSTEGQ